MKEVSINKNVRLSEHFTLGEVCKTKYQTRDGNIPSRVAIENLRNICENWLEDLRYSYNRLYVLPLGDVTREGQELSDVSDYHRCSSPCVSREEPIIITSGFRSPEVNRLAGGCATSNHLTGCAVDIRVAGIEQLIRYAGILLDIADGTKRDFDELLMERNAVGHYWLHFAVRPASQGNRRKVKFLQV